MLEPELYNDVKVVNAANRVVLTWPPHLDCKRSGIEKCREDDTTYPLVFFGLEIVKAVTELPAAASNANEHDFNGRRDVLIMLNVVFAMLLVAGCWLLVAGCWLLVAGCWCAGQLYGLYALAH